MEKRMSPAEVFPPGEFIADELAARGWTQEEFARILGRPLKTVNQIMSGKKRITPETSLELAQALGTSPDFWLNLESAYRLGQLPRDDRSVARRAELFSRVPLKQLIRRGWIEGADYEDLDRVEQAVCKFLSVASIEQDPAIAFAPRVAGSSDHDRRMQMAWVCRVRNLASAMMVSGYETRRLRQAVSELPRHSVNPAGISRLPMILSGLGIRLLFVPPLPSSRIDGAALWLNARSPVVALSLRRDRVDYFWFTLMHELAHILYRHGNRSNIVDNDLVGRDRADADTGRAQDDEANLQAENWLLPPSALQAFLKRSQRTGQYLKISRTAIEQFASRVHVHPGIVVGRLQYGRLVPWTHFRNLLVPVSDIVAQARLVDTVPAQLARAS